MKMNTTNVGMTHVIAAPLAAKIDTLSNRITQKSKKIKPLKNDIKSSVELWSKELTENLALNLEVVKKAKCQLPNDSCLVQLFLFIAVVGIVPTKRKLVIVRVNPSNGNIKRIFPVYRKVLGYTLFNWCVGKSFILNANFI
jgi:hypothetical protein